MEKDSFSILMELIMSDTLQRGMRMDKVGLLALMDGYIKAN